jgi:hypothetical protein
MPDRRDIMNAKASSEVLWMVGLGFLVFIIITFGIGHAVVNIFSHYKNSEKTVNTLVEATTTMLESADNVKFKRILLNLDEDTAVFVFTGNSDDLIENQVDIVGTSKYNDRRVVKKPAECANINDCICLCKDFSRKVIPDDEKKKLLDKYNAKSAFEIACAKGMSCHSIDPSPTDKVFQDKTELTNIVSDTMYKELQNAVPQSWEGGFSFYRTDAYGPQIIKTKFTDMFIVKNTEGKIYFCFDYDKCKPV